MKTVIKHGIRREIEDDKLPYWKKRGFEVVETVKKDAEEKGKGKAKK